MSNILAKICNLKKEHIAKCKIDLPHSELTVGLKYLPPIKSFSNALRSCSEAGYGLIGEIKKASPSKGLIREDFDPLQLALAYQKGGAACLSVLTDEPFFQGHNDFLATICKTTPLPILRKDFMLDPYQITEARMIGADCILLIMAALDDHTALDMENYAMELGMEVLIEVHDQDELERAFNLKSPLIGINNRNLKTMATNLATTEHLASFIPTEKILISESGLSTRSDLARMANIGVRCFLIGESLMRQNDVEQATRSILSNPTEQRIKK
jgi:indole-3-glycerol phosphate synthase